MMKPTPVSHAILGAMYWLPEKEVDAHRVRKRFTVEKTLRDYQTREESIQEIPSFRDGAGPLRGYLGVPIAAGEELFPTDDLREELSDGAPFTSWTRLPDPEHPRAAPGQAEFMRKMLDAARNQYTVLAKAETGTGKTVCALNTAAQLGGRPFIMVPLKRLMDQWTEQVHDILGVPYDKIGHVYGPKCQWGRDVVIGMMKSLAVREYPKELYSCARTLIVDEGHNTGAMLYSQTQGLFNARYKLMLTATDERRDGGDKVYHDFYGRPAFTQSMPAVATTVSVISYSAHKPPTGNNKAGKLIGLAYDWTRNSMMAKLALHWYRNGHYPLFIGDHVRHAEILYKMFMAEGIPENKIALYTGRQTVNGVSSETTKEYLDWAEKNAVVFIATYGMMKEGIDIPKLDRGCDYSPRTDLIQTLGRIRRRMPGKETAEWVTFRDRTVPSFERDYFARIAGLQKLPGVTIRKVKLDDILRS